MRKVCADSAAHTPASEEEMLNDLRAMLLEDEGGSDKGEESDNGDDKGTAQASDKEPPPSGGRAKRDRKAPEKAGEKTPPKGKKPKK